MSQVTDEFVGHGELAFEFLAAIDGVGQESLEACAVPLGEGRRRGVPRCRAWLNSSARGLALTSDVHAAAGSLAATDPPGDHLKRH